VAADDVALQFYPAFVRPIYSDETPMAGDRLRWLGCVIGRQLDRRLSAGEFFAELAIYFARDMGDGFLRFVLATIVHKGRFGPIEDGFVDRIARPARAGSLN
jgi:hypothetical protein